MEIRKALAATIGTIQSIIAVSTILFACAVYFDLYNIQTSLNIPEESVFFGVLALLGFGLLSLISGSFLTSEWLENR